MSFIDDYILKIVDERIKAALASINVSSSESVLAIERQTIAIEGLRSTMDALIESTRIHTDALGHIADMVKDNTTRIEDTRTRIDALESTNGSLVDKLAGPATSAP